MICYREDFNTSHVTVYRIAFILGNEVSVISIHPMLRFIDYGAPTMRKRFFNFNTSHVTVYQNPTLQPKGLSSFQYIPCYGLSMEQRRIIVWLSYFNTSHVTVYRDLFGALPFGYAISIHPMLRFILCWLVQYMFRMSISIHPMLRFIFLLQLHVPGKFLFQYIPCYGLSDHPDQRRSQSTYFNTSHVTVYHSNINLKKVMLPISIHPMLRFI